MTSQAGKPYRLTEDYESVGTAAKTSFDGSWKQTKAFQVKGKDTVESKNNQYKTYFASYIIWGHTYTDTLNKSHTVVGFGKFELKGADKLKETLIASTYYQVRGKDIDIDIEMKGADEFKQTLTQPDGTKFAEVYERMKK